MKLNETYKIRGNSFQLLGTLRIFPLAF